MSTITVTKSPDTAPSAAPGAKPVMVEVGTGDYLVMRRAGTNDPERRKAALRRIIDDMRTRVCDPRVETASDAIKAMRDARG